MPAPTACSTLGLGTGLCFRRAVTLCVFNELGKGTWEMLHRLTPSAPP